MGKIIELSCKCGYKKELYVGTGLMGINEKAVRRIFAPEELKDFDTAKDYDMLKGFIIKNVKAYCSLCNDIFALPTLKYKVGALDKSVSKNCPECGGKTIETEAATCPKCGNPLDEKAAGHWD